MHRMPSEGRCTIGRNTYLSAAFPLKSSQFLIVDVRLMRKSLRFDPLSRVGATTAS
jgi:hypothetical protein